MPEVTLDGSLFNVCRNQFGNGLVSLHPFQSGDLLYRFKGGVILPTPNYRSIQIAVDQHMDDLDIFANINHACEPNIYLEIESNIVTIYAAKQIKVGDELTFFYPSTEWDIAQKFDCTCQSAHCIGLVAGAKFLTAATLQRYPLSQHIRYLLNSA